MIPKADVKVVNSQTPLFCTCYYGNAVSILITIFPEVAVISTFNDDFLIIGREIFKAFIVFPDFDNDSPYACALCVRASISGLRASC